MKRIDNKEQIIVSLTSYPKRIQHVESVIKTLLIQTMKPDRIMLWLSVSEFPRKEDDLPSELVGLKKYGLEICWVMEDIKPHKKYFYSMREYSDAIIITVDDDVYYAPELIEILYNSYLRHPNAISCTRANLIVRDSKEELLPYDDWEKNYIYEEDIEKMDLLAVGCGGVLYPPRWFEKTDLFNKGIIHECCLFQDDLWLKLHEIVAEVPTVLAKQSYRVPMITIQGSQNDALCENENVLGNDNAIKNLSKYITSICGKTIAELLELYESKNPVQDETLKRHTEEIVNRILENKNFYIYGAGEGAKSTWGCLELIGQQQNVENFIVSKREQNPDELFGKRVMEIDQVQNKENIVIVSTADKYQSEIVNDLKARGFKTILSVNNRLIGEYNYCQKKMKGVLQEFLYLCKLE